MKLPQKYNYKSVVDNLNVHFCRWSFFYAMGLYMTLVVAFHDAFGVGGISDILMICILFYFLAVIHIFKFLSFMAKGKDKWAT